MALAQNPSQAMAAIRKAVGAL
jgi:NAD-dependent SIR2 family protein deacetylase